LSYYQTLEAAGAEVLNFKEFGSYQGTWLAFVMHKGEIGIVEGSYGSCSGCDSFKAEFSYSSKPEEIDGKFYKDGMTWDEDSECTKEEYDEAMERYNERFAEFGRGYLESNGQPCLYSKSHYENKLAELDKDDWLDSEEAEYCKWAIDQNWDN